MTLYYYGVDNNLGGLENYAKTLLTGIKQLSPTINIVIITEYEDVAYKDYFASLGIDILVIPQKKYFIKYYTSIKKILKMHKNNDIIQLNVMSYRNSLLFKAVKKSKIKTVVVGHSTNLAGGIISLLIHKINKYRFRKLGNKVAINNKVIPYMFTHGAKVTIIKNIIDSSKYEYEEKHRITIRSELGFNSNTFVIGQIGRICYQKNQLFTLSLFNKLSKKYNNIKLIYIGKNLDNKITNKILEVHNPNIILLDQLDNVNEYYSAFDLVLLPSIFEGNPLTALETLKNGCPLIISDKIQSNYEIHNYITLPLDLHLWEKEIIKIYSNTSNIKRIPSPVLPDYEFFGSYLRLYKNNIP